MTVFITLTTAGTDSGPFNLYSDWDGFVTPFAVGVSKIDLEAGYSASSVPDFTSVVRVLSTAQYCINYVDITLGFPPTTTSTTTTECLRPSGLINKPLYFNYVPEEGPSFMFTNSFSDACFAANEFSTNSPPGVMEGIIGQIDSFNIGETVYSGVGPDCTLVADGFYITDLATQEVTEIVNGIINSITLCV